MVVVILILYIVASVFTWPYVHDWLGPPDDPVVSLALTMGVVAIPAFLLAAAVDKAEGN